MGSHSHMEICLGRLVGLAHKHILLDANEAPRRPSSQMKAALLEGFGPETMDACACVARGYCVYIWPLIPAFLA